MSCRVRGGHTRDPPVALPEFGFCGLRAGNHPSHPLTTKIISNGDSIVENIFHMTPPMAQNSARPAKPAKPQPNAARITEISDEEACPQCHCVLTRSEIN